MVNLTNEYKTQMLEWLTGNYQVEERTDELSFYETESINTGDFYNSVIDKLHELFGNEGSFDLLDSFKMLTGSNNSNNGESFTLIYGGYDGNGYIMLLDEDSNIEYVITEYSSGTPFKPIKSMGMAEDGTFFMVEETDTYPRFIMLNNILAKLPESENYEAVLRKSYMFPNNYFPRFFDVIKKAPGQSKYLMVNLQPSGNNANVAIELEVNVGTSNEWNVYTTSLTNQNFFTYDVYTNWDVNGDLSFKIGGLNQHQDLSIYYSEITGTSSSTTTTKTEFFQINIANLYGLQKKFNLFYKSTTETYLSFVETEVSSDKVSIGYINYNNNSFVSLFTGYPSTYTVNSVWFYPIDDEIMICYFSRGDDNNNHLRFGRIEDNKLYIKELYTTTYNLGLLPYFSVSKQFNLYQYKFQIISELIKAKEIYNSNNYNGTGYQDYNSMIPNSAVILDENDLIVFARNLYNRLVQGNSTTAILQIPYDYVNGIILKTQQLFGETNQKLIENVSQFTKNIYEEAMLSFINMITMQNKNNPDNIIKNIAGAIKLNQSISDSLDYNNTKATKIRINHNDNTTKIVNISSTINGLTATYNFVVYIDKAIDTIDIISNDETTIYCSIDASNYEVGKYYKITQEVIIN